MTEQEANNIRKGILKTSSNGVLDIVSEPLEIGQLTIKPIDNDKEIEFQIWEYYEYINVDDANTV